MAKTHVIDGVTYVEVERKADVGDYVINNKGTEYEACYKVTGYTDEFFPSYKVDYSANQYEDEYITSVSIDRSITLEPIQTVDTTQASEQVIEMLANLARRVTSLERQLAVTQNNVERQAEELENAKHRISKHATMFGAVEEKVEMLTDDVITLDERTQVVNAINKYYAEGSR
jgi:hypothetical protein